MSVDANTSADAKPAKKSNKLLWFGGCGCLVILLMCGGGIGVFAIPGWAAYQVVNEAHTLTMESDSVQAVIGSPITIAQPAQSQEGDDITMRFPVSGPDGTGTLVLTFHMESFSNFEATVMKVEFDDAETIDLLNNDELEIDVEDPDS